MPTIEITKINPDIIEQENIEENIEEENIGAI